MASADFPALTIPSLLLDLLHNEAFKNVAFLNVVELLDRHTAFVTGRDLLDRVLEALQGAELALMDDDIVAQNADRRVARDLAVLDVAARDRADLRHLERLAHLGDAGVLLDDIGRKQADACGVDVLDRLVDDAVQADVHLLLLGLLLRLARRAHVEADDDGVGRRGERDVGLGDAAHRRVDDVDAHLGLIHLLERIAQRLDGALHVGLHDEVQIGGLAVLDAAEQVVRLSLEGFEVAAKLTGSAAKNVALLLVSVLKQEQQTKGKARLTNMIKSGKELKVFSIPNKDLAQFTKQAKRYGVLYCVLRDKSAKGDDVPVDIIARAEDASKIQRIVERFEIGKVDKAGVITQAEQDKADREAVAREVPTNTKGEIIVEEAMGKPLQKEGQSHENPTVAKTEKSPPSERSSEISGTVTDRGTAKQADKKPSVREKLERYKTAAKADKEADRAEPALSKEKSKTPEPNRQTVHTQPKKHKKSKER